MKYLLKTSLPVLVFLLIFQPNLIKANLICNGDFQTYSPFFSFNVLNLFSIKTTLITSNTNCWYRYPTGSIQIMTFSYAPWFTNTVELAGYDGLPYSLCQKLNLTVSQNYSFSVDVRHPKYANTSTAFAYLNNVQIGRVTVEDYTIRAKIQHNFSALVIGNEFCINGTTIIYNQTILKQKDFTPLIDNVTVLLIPKPSNTSTNNNTSISTNTNASSNISTNTTSNTSTTPIQSNSATNTTNTNTNTNSNTNTTLVPGEVYAYMQMNMDVNEQQGYIHLNSETPMITGDLFNALSSNIKFYIEGQEQNKVQSNYIEGTQLNIMIYVQRSYNVQTISLVLPEKIGYKNYQFRVIMIINGRPVYILLLSKDMIKIVQSIQPVSTAVVNVISNSYSILRSTFCSYFIVNLMNFYSITLMYNFLSIPAHPIFSHNALEKLAQIFYMRNSLIKYLTDIFNSSHIKQLSQFKFFVNNSNSKERIPSFENDFSWFGLMGATYNFLANNFENMAILFLIVPKVLLAKLVHFTLMKCIGRTLFSLESYPEIFFAELIGMCPLMVVSAYESLLNCGYEYVNERINIVLHILLLQMMIMCPFILFIYNSRGAIKQLRFRKTKYNQIQKKYRKRLKQLNQNSQLLANKKKYAKRKKQIRKQIENQTDQQSKCKDCLQQNPLHFTRYTTNNRLILLCTLNLLQLSLNILVPALVVLRSQLAFFVVISIVMLSLLVLFLLGFSVLSVRERMVRGLIILIYNIHHFSFLMFYLVSYLDETVKKKIYTTNVCGIVGIVVIFTVVCGAGVEIINFAITVLLTILSLCTRFVTYLCLQKNKFRVKQFPYQGYENDNGFQSNRKKDTNVIMIAVQQVCKQINNLPNKKVIYVKNGQNSGSLQKNRIKHVKLSKLVNKRKQDKKKETKTTSKKDKIQSTQSDERNNELENQNQYNRNNQGQYLQKTKNNLQNQEPRVLRRKNAGMSRFYKYKN